MDQESILRNLRTKAIAATVARDGLRTEISRVRGVIAKGEDDAMLLEHVAAVIRRLVDGEITDGVKAIEVLQTEGLRSVFHDQDLRVRAEIGVVRGKVSVDLLTSHRREDGTIVKAPALDAFGGAVTTIQSVLLRLSLIFRRGLRPVLFLDETLPAIDERYIHRTATFLKALCERLDVGILVVTHNQALLDASDCAYRIRKDPASSTIHKIERKS